jgi:hypothetical protein
MGPFHAALTHRQGACTASRLTIQSLRFLPPAVEPALRCDNGHVLCRGCVIQAMRASLAASPSHRGKVFCAWRGGFGARARCGSPPFDADDITRQLLLPLPGEER